MGFLYNLLVRLQYIINMWRCWIVDQEDGIKRFYKERWKHNNRTCADGSEKGCGIRVIVGKKGAV